TVLYGRGSTGSIQESCRSRRGGRSASGSLRLEGIWDGCVAKRRSTELAHFIDSGSSGRPRSSTHARGAAAASSGRRRTREERRGRHTGGAVHALRHWERGTA